MSRQQRRRLRVTITKTTQWADKKRGAFAPAIKGILFASSFPAPLRPGARAANRVCQSSAFGGSSRSGLDPFFRDAGAGVKREVFSAVREGDFVAAFGDVPGAAVRVEVGQQARVGGDCGRGALARFQSEA